MKIKGKVVKLSEVPPRKGYGGYRDFVLSIDSKLADGSAFKVERSENQSKVYSSAVWHLKEMKKASLVSPNLEIAIRRGDLYLFKTNRS